MAFRDHYLPLIIPKERLVQGHYYAGTCRNAQIAKWDSNTNLFYHWRDKFGHVFRENIEYWEPEGVYDGFIPIFDLGEALPDPISIPGEEEK